MTNRRVSFFAFLLVDLVGVVLCSVLVTLIVCVCTPTRSASDVDTVIGEIEDMANGEGVVGKCVGVPCMGVACLDTGEIDDHGF